MVDKVPEFSAESLCLRQGMVTSGCWCHMTLLDGGSCVLLAVQQML